MMRGLAAAALVALALGHAAAAPAAPAATDDARFDEAVQAYYDEWLPLHPTEATALGFHRWDAQLEDLSAPARAREAARLRSWQARLAGFDERRLSAARAVDLSVLRSAVEAKRLSIEELRPWRREPSLYPGQASEAVYVLMKRSFAPAATRLGAVIARERAIPALLAEGQKNLTEVPRVALDIARDELPGIVEFFRRDVPLAFADVKDPALQKELAASTRGVVDALTAYQKFLDDKLAPAARPDFAIGAALYAKKLRAEEQIDTPLDALLLRGEAELRRLQADFRATAARLDPKRSAAEVLASLEKDHEPAARLIPSVQASLDGIRRFIVDKKLLSLPADRLPRVQETPPFMRATTLASMDTPGPFETGATDAYYNVTLPDPTWSAAATEDYLRGAFSRPLALVTSIHEALPGHWVQFVWLARVPSMVRKIEGASSNAEGWAHYCEQMMLDEGYGDPALRLMQLRDALLRAARYVVGIRMHTRGMSFDEAVTFFQKEGMQTASVARVEARRGTVDPTYLYYTWGKLELLRLRADYQKKLGKDYTLARFHDAVLAEGPIPLPLLRRALLDR